MLSKYDIYPQRNPLLQGQGDVLMYYISGVTDIRCKIHFLESGASLFIFPTIPILTLPRTKN